MNIEQQYIGLFAQYEAMVCRRSAEPINAPWTAAFAGFKRQGSPTRKQEKYKCMDVSKLSEPDYGLNPNRLPIPVNPYEVSKYNVPNMSTSLFLVMSGTFHNQALPRSKLPEEVVFDGLRKMAERHPELVEKYYGKLADTSEDAVTVFNTVFIQGGVLVYAPKSVVIDKPIQLVNILRADVNFMVNRHVLVILEGGAQARLLVCDHAIDNVDSLTTQVAEVLTEESSVFDLYELEEAHTSTVCFSNLYTEQGTDSSVLSNGMTLHNRTTRSTTEVTLAGEDVEISLCDVTIAGKDQHVDDGTSIDRTVPGCTSNKLFKYVFDDRPVDVFAGLVLVRPNTQHTSSQQTNHNLYAAHDTCTYTRPQLEMYADDVKCPHGATADQLDEDALFYMHARGIVEKGTRLLLMSVSVDEMVDTIRLKALKDRLRLLAEKRFRDELNKCQGCSVHKQSVIK